MPSPNTPSPPLQPQKNAAKATTTTKNRRQNPIFPTRIRKRHISRPEFPVCGAGQDRPCTGGRQTGDGGWRTGDGGWRTRAGGWRTGAGGWRTGAGRVPPGGPGWNASVQEGALGSGKQKDGGFLHQSRNPRCPELRKSFRISQRTAPIPRLFACQGLRSCRSADTAHRPIRQPRICISTPYTSI